MSFTGKTVIVEVALPAPNFAGAAESHRCYFSLNHRFFEKLMEAPLRFEVLENSSPQIAMTKGMLLLTEITTRSNKPYVEKVGKTLNLANF